MQLAFFIRYPLGNDKEVVGTVNGFSPALRKALSIKLLENAFANTRKCDGQNLVHTSCFSPNPLARWNLEKQVRALVPRYEIRRAKKLAA